MNDTSVNEQHRPSHSCSPAHKTALSVRTSSVHCRHNTEFSFYYSSYCPTKEQCTTLTHVLSVFRGNFTLQRNSINQNKAVFQLHPKGVRCNWTITHFLSLDISNHGTYGAVAYLVRGGIGSDYVSIGYTYLPTYGMDHLLEIYGRQSQ